MKNIFSLSSDSFPYIHRQCLFSTEWRFFIFYILSDDYFSIPFDYLDDLFGLFEMAFWPKPSTKIKLLFMWIFFSLFVYQAPPFPNFLSFCLIFMGSVCWLMATNLMKAFFIVNNMESAFNGIVNKFVYF